MLEAFQGWIHHARQYFPCCLARENIPAMLMRSFDQTETEDRMQPHFLFLSIEHISVQLVLRNVIILS